MKKAAISGLMIISFLLMLCGLASAELSSPQNVRWKDGSTATAAWDAVDGAESYFVTVNIYSENNTFLGSTKTGTNILECDLQQEIQKYIGSNKKVYASFFVSAATISDNGDPRIGTSSVTSSMKEYIIPGCSVLGTPQNVNLSDNLIATWEPVPNKDYYNVTVFYAGEGKTYSAWITTTSTSVDVANTLKASYNTSSLVGKEVNVWVKVQAVAYSSINSNPDYVSGAHSDSSNMISFISQGATTLGTPQNVSLSDNLSATWEPVPHRDYYNVTVFYSGEGKTYSAWITTTSTSLDVTNTLKASYNTSSLVGKEVNVWVKVQAVAYSSINSNPDYVSGAHSDSSNMISFIGQGATKLGTPQNVSLSDNLTATWEPVPHRDYYNVTVFYAGEGKTYSAWITTTSTSLDVTNTLKASYNTSSLVGKEVDVWVKVQAVAYSSINSNPDYVSSALSEQSNVIIYREHIDVSDISLSPSKPIVFTNHSLYMGKTIIPENAYYTSINWTTSNSDIVSVDDVGMITGHNIGRADITANIGDATDTVTATVYTIETNIIDSNNSQIATETAGTIIDDIGNNDNPDLSNTDIINSETENLHDQIHAGIERGDTFRIDWWWNQYSSGHFGPWWNEILNLLGHGQFVCGYDAGFEMYHEEANGTHHTIGNITEFDQEIEFSFELPDLPDVQTGFFREFSLARIHNGKVEKIPVNIERNEFWSARSDRFSDFVLLYNDKPIQESQKVTVEYTCPSETAEIGKPYTLGYEIKGGSGQYEQIWFTMFQITEHCSVNDNYKEGSLSTSKGTITVIPECGETFIVNVGCIDAETGLSWSENSSNIISCTPNTDIPVNINIVTPTLALNEPFTFNYTIGGENDINEARIEIWAFTRNETYPDCVLEKKIETKEGTIVYTPIVGNQLYIAVRGKDSEGHPFYVKTARLDVNAENGYDPVTVNYTCPSETAEIGKPYTLGYEIKGGSGQYEQIWFTMFQITEHCSVNDNYKEGSLSSSKGTITVIPECGETFIVNVGCIDAETGLSWSENSSNIISCTPNTDIPATISNITEIISINEPFSFEYSIGGTNELSEARAEVWLFARNETYPDRVLEQSIESKNGTITYTPKAGNQLYIAIRGKDSEGKPFYIKTDRLSISEEDLLSNCLILPASIKVIEEEAFSYVNATKIYIPSSVESIDPNAFTGSKIRIILGNSDYIEEYANTYGFQYRKYNPQ